MKIEVDKFNMEFFAISLQSKGWVKFKVLEHHNNFISSFITVIQRAYEGLLFNYF